MLLEYPGKRSTKRPGWSSSSLASTTSAPLRISTRLPSGRSTTEKANGSSPPGSVITAR